MKYNKKDIVITGEWDGEKIWRKNTMGELLLEEINKNKHERNKKNI